MLVKQERQRKHNQTIKFAHFLRRLGIRKKLLNQKTVITADTGLPTKTTTPTCITKRLTAYIPDNKFRSRDPKFAKQKVKCEKRHQTDKATGASNLIPATESAFDPIAMSCYCTAGNLISFRGTRNDEYGHRKALFEGRLMQCRNCAIKSECMQNPSAADHRKGVGRQVSFIIGRANYQLSYTDLMKQRVDSEKGKSIYVHRMSVVEPVFCEHRYE